VRSCSRRWVRSARVTSFFASTAPQVVVDDREQFVFEPCQIPVDVGVECFTVDRFGSGGFVEFTLHTLECSALRQVGLM
jgi:hypothetical protein